MDIIRDKHYILKEVMSVLSEIFGDYPRVKILEAFADHFEEELSIPGIIWLTDVPKTMVHKCIKKLLDEKFLLEGDTLGETQFYYLNNEKQEIQIIISERLAEKLEERGLV